MKFVFKASFWTLAVFGLWSLLQAVWLYHSFPQDSDIAYERNDSRPVELSELLCGEHGTSGVNIVDMAIIAAETYAPRESPRKQLLSPDWEKVAFSTVDRKELFPNERISGLHFDFWINASKSIGVISFRGTSDIWDWHANMHPLSKYLGINTQYQKVRRAAPQMVAFLNDKTGELGRIYAVGHSLGGGLAQHAVYSNADIARAFVFNSSPVTGWRDVNEDVRSTAVAGNRITRIHEDGELLEFLRLLMKFGYTLNPLPNEDPYFEEYRMNFEKHAGWRSTHSIEWLADKMISYNNQRCGNGPSN